MPVEFDSIRTEHGSVRERAGIFDVSHMSEIEVSGPDAGALMNRLVTNDVTRPDPGESQYALITDEEGIIHDDTILYRLPERSDAEWLFVPNAGHDAEMTDRWRTRRDEWGLDATVENATESWAVFAVQGPDAPGLVAAETDADLDMSHGDARHATVAGIETLVSRTGYTGEPGYELFVPWDDAETVWTAIDCQPCGLGARDTLRLEMGYPLSGNEFDPEAERRSPYEAGLGFAVKLGIEFVGRDALEAQDAEGVEETLVGFALVDRGVPRHGYDVADPDGDVIGHVTSGTMSPTLDDAIGMAYVPTEYADPGTSVRVLVRGEPKKAVVRATPFTEEP